MPSIDTVVIGAGQAGLAASRCLHDASIDHVVLERGRVGERWRSERWDSLRLLTPNWATRLPGWGYRGGDPDGFMPAAHFAGYLARYVASFDAPVHDGIAVTSVERCGDGFTVRTDDGTWRATNVVVATGWCDRPRIPASATSLSTSVLQLAPTAYRNPGALPAGGVLVVGASASGVQLADELARAGRNVVLAVGAHSRLPRRYRGADIWRWLEALGTFAETIDDSRDASRARFAGSVQLVGRTGRAVDLPALHALGVRLTGRLAAVDGTRLGFADDLASSTAAADDAMARVLAAVDDLIARRGLDLPPAPVPSVLPAAAVITDLDLRRAGITTIVWAAGFTRRYPWLRVPVVDERGEIRQRRGVTPVPGLYVLGQRFQHRRDSNFIDGVRHDAATIVHNIVDGRRDEPLAS